MIECYNTKQFIHDTNGKYSNQKKPRMEDFKP